MARNVSRSEKDRSSLEQGKIGIIDTVTLFAKKHGNFAMLQELKSTLGNRGRG